MATLIKYIINIFTILIMSSFAFLSVFFILAIYSLITLFFAIILASLIHIGIVIELYLVMSIIITVIIIINTVLYLYFFIKNKLKELVIIIILGLIAMLFFSFLSKTDKHQFIDFMLVIVSLSGFLLLNIIILIYLSILAISLIPKYKNKYKERLIPYCKLAIYSTFVAGIFGYLIYIYN